MLYSVEVKMKRLRLNQKVIASAVIAATACALAYEIVTAYLVSSQYYKWSAGLLDRPYHQDYPLGRASAAGLHFGACLTDATNGDGYEMYCDGIQEGPNTTTVLWRGHDGSNLSLCAVLGGKSVVVLVPLPNFELP